MGARGGLLVIVLLLSCAESRPPEGHSAPPWVPVEPKPSEIVARVGDVAISAAAVRAQVALTGSSPEAAVESLISFHLLAEAARAAGLWTRQLRDAVPKELWVQRLLELELEPTLDEQSIPDADLRAIYDREKYRFVHPRLVEIAALVVYTGGRMKPEPRARARAVAQELKTAVDARDVNTPEDLWSLSEDPAWKAKKVSFLRLIQGPDRPLSPVVGSAVARLRKAGDTTPLLEDETGLYVARFIAEVPPKNVSFAEAREQLRAGYHELWRQQRFRHLAKGLAARHRIEMVSPPL